jgi:hypothetical protein
VIDAPVVAVLAVPTATAPVFVAVVSAVPVVADCVLTVASVIALFAGIVDKCAFKMKVSPADAVTVLVDANVIGITTEVPTTDWAVGSVP